MDKTQYLHQNSRKHAKKIGWLCTYVPEEIIIAYGFKPFRITGNKKAKKSEGYFPINFCPFVKSAMEEILDNEDDLEGIIFTNSCDAMKRSYDLVTHYIPGLPAFMLDVPRNKNELALRHYKDSICGMVQFLENILNDKSGIDHLENAVRVCSKKRVLLKKLKALFKKAPGVIRASDYFGMLKASMIKEPEAFIDELKDFIAERENIINSPVEDKGNPGKDIEKNRGIMVVGNFIDEKELWCIFDELECRVSSDDMCSSSRYFEDIYGSEELEMVINSDHYIAEKNKPDGDTDKILTDIALRYLFKPQCMRMSNLGIKVDEIKSEIVNNHIKGLIFISQKFCDNTLLFYPLLRQYLNDIKVPSLFLEIEHNNISRGQLKTRIQAFIEII